jgi:hypothetical protein
MGHLTRDQIRTHAPGLDLAWEDVDVPEWPDANGEPGMVRMFEMNAGESVRFTQLTAGEKALDALYIVIVLTARSVEGEPLFTLDDLDLLRSKNMRVLMRLQLAALRVNKMMTGRVLELKKTLSEAEPDASPIASLNSLAK